MLSGDICTLIFCVPFSELQDEVDSPHFSLQTAQTIFPTMLAFRGSCPVTVFMTSGVDMECLAKFADSTESTGPTLFSASCQKFGTSGTGAENESSYAFARSAMVMILKYLAVN